jgi:hypothetical protein
MLNYLPNWIDSNKKILSSDNFDIEVSPVLGDEKKARYIELSNNKIFARVTIWETGEAEFDAIDCETSKDVLDKSMVIFEWQLDEKLNWWLSEVVAYSG